MPKEGPHIDGGHPRYAHGDTVQVNCTSPKSRPAASLAWFVNGDPVSLFKLLATAMVTVKVNSVFLVKFQAEDNLLRHYPTTTDEGGLETVILGLEFKVIQ